VFHHQTRSAAYKMMRNQLPHSWPLKPTAVTAVHDCL